MITRVLTDKIISRMNEGKAIILVGARQVGKTTLFKNVSDSLNEPVLELNCDSPEVRTLVEEPSDVSLRRMIGNSKVLLIDEAQRVKGIGLTLKRIVDGFPDVQLLVTGSSALNINKELNEPLTGRKFEYSLYPISTNELMLTGGLLEVNRSLDFRLIYGSYPDVLTHANNAQELLDTLADSYLYKDLLSYEGIRRPELLNKLLLALSLQVGSEVSYNELAQTVGTDNKTVEKYIDLLEKCFVVYRLGALSRNARNEIKRGRKIYFYDNGIRNAVAKNFAPIGLRSDMGLLWENFFITERLKFNHYRGYRAHCYFWRTAQQQEVDYVEERDGQFTLFEMKWNPKKSNVKVPKAFRDNYNVASAHVVTPDNYIDFLVD